MGLLVVPFLVTWLLFGEGLTGISVLLARVTGTALVGLGFSCWPSWTALYGILTYSVLVTLYLAYLGIYGESVGVLLWPAVVLHSVLTLLLAGLCLKAWRDGLV